MKISIRPSRGVTPRLAPQLLPPDGAQVAQNAKLLSGDLEAWNDVEFVSQLFKAGTVNTIHLMARQHWLHWVDAELAAGAVEVDVARGPIAGDVTERTYFAGVAGGPRVTNIAKAIGACGQQYPCDSLLLGIPAPTEAPVVEPQGGESEPSNVQIDNPGAETGGIAGWLVDAGDLGVHNSTDVPGLAAKEGLYFFHGGNVAETRSHQTLVLEQVGVVSGQGLELAWWQARGANGSQASMSLAFLDEDDVEVGRVDAATEAVAAALTWVRRTIGGQVPSDATQVRLEKRFLRVGGGANDAYIDDISLNSQDYSKSFSCENFDGWTVSPNSGQSNTFRQMRIEPGTGQPAPCWLYEGDSRWGYAYQDFNTERSPRVRVQFESQVNGNNHMALYTGATSSGQGFGLTVNPGGSISWNSKTSWEDAGTLVETIAADSGAFYGDWLVYDVDILLRDQGRATATVTIKDKATGTLIVDEVETDIEINGPYWGFNSRSNFHDRYTYWDNITLTIVAPTPTTSDETVFVNYVYLFGNEFQEEGPPGPRSRTIQRTGSATTKVTTPVTAPPGYGITHKYIYRGATGATSSAYLLVEKIPLDQAEYIDKKADADLGKALESELFDLPPADLQGLVALPNRFLAGFSKNELVLSAQGRYYGWPVDYRQATDFPIVAIGAIDADIIVLTESFPYVATGYTPDAISMRKLEVAYACSSKRSVANLKDFGIVYSSPDGIVAINGQGAPVLLTAGLLTREQWQELNPASIYGVAHDDRYFGFYQKAGGERGGFILDAKQGGFGLVFIDVWAQAAFSDPLTDRLYLVMENEIRGWDRSAGKLPHRWRSRLFMLPRPASFGAAQVHAVDFADLTMRVFADGTEIFVRPITSLLEFRLPDKLALKSIEIELSGTSRVQLVEIAEEMEELEGLE